MQKLTYDYYNNIEIPTFVLSNIYHHHIGVINNIDTESIQFNFNMNSQQEVSCDVYKELNGEKCELWDKIISLKYIYIPEHEEYYKVDVTVDDGEYTVKHLTLTSAGEYELSNKYITLEINTESDILRNVDDTTNPPYAPNVLYNPNDVDNSILHRVLKDKAPDWSIVHCDESIANIQRTFTISNQKIYDVLTNTLAKEYNCLFKFDSVKREIYCYDLYNRCEECGERGEFVYECPQCGSKKIQYGYGKNTNIFITYNNFSEKITLDGDEGAVKNCFRVTGGDDYMNATVRNINPNGSDYIYNFSQNDYDDMPTELVEGLQAYQEKYDELLEPYQEYTEKWYDAINNYYFYKTSMMPRSNGILWEANKGYNLNDETYVKSLATWAYLKCVKAGISGDEMFDATNASDGQLFEDGTVVWQVVKHIISIPSAEESYNAIVEYFHDNVIYFQREIPSSITLVNNEIVNMAKLAINNIFKVEVVIDGTNKVVGNTWYGRLKVTNSGNSEDTYKPDFPLSVTIGVYNNLLSYTKYIEDKVVKRINKADTTFINLYDLDYPDVYPYSKDADTVFKALLTQYGLDSLSSFSKSYQSCLDVLVANGIKDKNSTYQDSDYMVWDIYTPIYLPIYGRKELVDEEIERRETTVNRWAQLRDDYRAEMDNIQNQLKLQNFLGDDLFKIFFSYIREDNYTNSNYISTGISDGEVISYAKLLLNTAEKELKKACELQITLSDNIKNLLNTDEFKNYKDNYNIGDYIFVECDGDDWDGGDVNNGLYRLRLISASYSFSSPGDINFTFSNATRLNNFFSDAQSIINAAQSINGSYQVVVHQIEKTTNVTDNITDVIDHGFSATNSILANNNNEEVSMGDYGIYAKEYDDITNDYSPKQLRITHNILALTDDNWETTKVAIGENHYRFYNTDPQRGAIGWTEVDDYGVNANFVQGGYIIGGEIIGTEVVSSNYQVADPSQGIKADGSYINLNDGSFTLAGGGLVGYRNQDGTYYLNYKGNVTGVLDVDVGSTLGVWTVGADGFYSGSSVVKPDHISVTGNIRANDFFIGTSTTTRLSTILDNKQDLLTAGDYISIDPTTNRISATYSVFTGATSEADGEAGLVKKPLISDRTKFLCGDGTWAVPTGGTNVEPNPVEPATDTLNSIKIDDTVYEIVGSGTGGVEMHQGIDVPDSSLGNNDDIYLQMKSTIGNLLSFDASHSGAAITNYSATVTDNKWDITATFVDNWEYHSFAVYSLQNLTVGKKYTISFDFQNDGTPPLYGIGELFGLTLQHSNRVIDMRNWSSDLVENGEFKYFENSYYGEWWYQSFPNDTKRVHYEFEFTARQGTEYIGFYGDRTSGSLTCSLYELCVGDRVETNEIKDVFYKINEEWLLYEGGETYEAGDNILIEENVISGNYQAFSGTDGTEDGASGLVPKPLTTDADKFLKSDGTWAEVQGGGGAGGSSVYSEKVLYKASDNTFTNIQVDFTEDYDAYIFYCNDVIIQKAESYFYVKSEIKDAIANNIVISMYPYGSDGYCQYYISNSGLTTLTNRGGFFIYKIVGLKFGTLSPIIYSTEEREVGVWTDNKPLYQKTFILNQTVSNYQWTENILGTSGSGIEIKKYDGYLGVNNEGYPTLPIDWCRSSTSYSTTNMSSNSDDLSIRPNVESVSSVQIIYVTIQYTKTTDTAGSGSYTTLGIPAHHYDSNEKIIGTWFGETLYERTFNGLATNTNGDNWVNIGGIDVSTWKDAVNVEIYCNSSDVNNKLTRIALGEARIFNGNVQVTTSVSYNRQINVATIQYTKTS